MWNVFESKHQICLLMKNEWNALWNWSKKVLEFSCQWSCMQKKWYSRSKTQLFGLFKNDSSRESIQVLFLLFPPFSSLKHPNLKNILFFCPSLLLNFRWYHKWISSASQSCAKHLIWSFPRCHLNFPIFNL